MNLQYLQEVADHRVGVLWPRFAAVWPTIQKSVPKVVINKRLKTTAGRAFLCDNPQYIDLSAELFWEYTEAFIVDTIPHELAHLVAYTVYGDEGHGKGWKTVCEKMNIKTSRLHQMVNSVHAKRKAK